MRKNSRKSTSMEQWTITITPSKGVHAPDMREVYHYHDLISLLVKRNFTTMYKQTILGPLWVFINPLLTTMMFTVVFGNIAAIPTDGLPQFLFYMSGNVLWSFFSYCLLQTSSTFRANEHIFGKVYFPRLVMPISVVLTGLINFAVQFLMFLVITGFFVIRGMPFQWNFAMLLIPVCILQLAILGLGCGIIISSLTTKYRDLGILVNFGIQLWMYATPIVYPISQIHGPLKSLMFLNPVAPIIETFRYACLGAGELNFLYVSVSLAITCCILWIGLLLFSKIEKTFMDTI